MASAWLLLLTLGSAAASGQSVPPGEAADDAKGLAEFAKEHKIALVIGINQYEKRTGFRPLRHAANDAASFDELLREKFGFKNIQLLRDPEAGAPFNPDTIPNFANMTRAQDRFLNEIHKDSVVVIHYSGHGLRHDQSDFWVPNDADVPSLRISASKLLADVRRREPRRVLFFFDACREDEQMPAEARAARPLGIFAPSTPISFTKAAAALYACREKQFSREYPDKPKHGIFTHYLLQGLGEGAPFAVAPGTQNVTYASLRDYVQPKVQAATRGMGLGEQTPDGWAEPEKVVLVRVPKELMPQVDALLNDAESALNTDPDTAAGLATQVLGIAPSGRAHYILARVYFTQRNLRAAREHVRKAVALEYDNDVVWGLGEEISKALKPSGKVDFFRTRAGFTARRQAQLAAFQAPDERSSRKLVADAHERFDRGEFEAAIQLIDQAIQTDPRSGEARLLQGRILFLEQKYAEAVEAFQAARTLGIEPRRVRDYLESAESAAQLTRAEEHVRQSISALLNGRLDEADAALDAAFRLNPRSAGAYEMLGRLRLEQRRIPEAIEALRRAVELKPGLESAYEQLALAEREQRRAAARALSQEAGLLLDQGKPAPARERAGRAEVLTPNDAGVQLLLARIHSAEMRPDEAIRAYQRALVIHPGLQPAESGLASVLAGRPKAAVEELVRRGNALLATDPPGAERAAREAVGRNPEHGPARLLLGEALLRAASRTTEQSQLREADFREAEAHFQRARSLRVEGVEAGLERLQRARHAFYAAERAREAHKFVKRDGYPEAAARARSALDLDPENADAHAVLGYSLLKLGRDPAATEASIRKALQLSAQPGRNSALAHTALGTLLYERKEFKKAEAAFKEALRIEPRLVLALNNLSAVYQATRDWKAAERNLELARDTERDYAYAHANLGSLYLTQGKWKQAAQAYQEATRLNQQNGLFRAWLSLALLRSGDKVGARTMAQEALRMGVLRHPVYRELGIRS